MQKTIEPFSLAEESKIQESIEKVAREWGAHICDILEKLKFCDTINIAIGKDKAKIPHLRILAKILDTIQLSASYSKPSLSKERYENMYSIVSKNSNVELRVTLKNTNKVFSNSNHNKETLNLSPEFDRLLTSYNQLPLSINKEALDDLLKVHRLAVNAYHTPKFYNDPSLIIFFKIFYFIDITAYYKQNKEDSLYGPVLKELINFGLQLKHNLSQDKRLQEKCINHAAFNQLYNTLSSYKFIIQGLLNDSYLFSHFKHFYIIKYPTSSGRLSTESFFLQLQGFKLARSLITFAKQPKHTQESYSNFINIVSRKLPHIKIPEDLLSLDKYNLYKKSLFLKYGHSMTKLDQPLDLKSYPVEKVLQIQLEWLNNNVGKAEDIWVLRNNLHALHKDDFDHCIFQKDATSSGLQLIGLLTNSVFLCKSANVVGSAYCDIYQSEADILSKKIEQCYTFIRGPLKELVEKHVPGGQSSNNLFYQLLTSDIVWEKHMLKRANITNLLSSDIDLVVDLTSIKLPNFSFSSEEDIKRKKDDMLFVIINRIRQYLKLTKILENNPELKSIVGHRKAIKQIIMILGYQAGKRARLLHLETYYKEQLLAKGHETVNPGEIKLLAELVSQLIEEAIKERLDDLRYFGTVARKFIQEKIYSHQPVLIKTPYLEWSFVRRTQRIIRYTVNKFKLAIYMAGDICEDEMVTAFPSVFIQGAEAFIVHDFIETVRQLNLECNAHKVPIMNIFVNHDNFGMNTMYAHFLPILVRHSYNKVYKLRSNLPALQKEVEINSYKQLVCTNPNFIKH